MTALETPDTGQEADDHNVVDLDAIGGTPPDPEMVELKRMGVNIGEFEGHPVPDMTVSNEPEAVGATADKEPTHDTYTDTVGSSDPDGLERLRRLTQERQEREESQAHVLPGVGDIPATDRELVEKSLAEASEVPDDTTERSPRKEGESPAAYVRRLASEAAQGVGGTVSDGIHETPNPQQIDHGEVIDLAARRQQSDSKAGSQARHPARGNVPPRTEQG